MTDSTDYSAPALMHRCQGCGKWSHAKKKPKKHSRTVYEGDPLFDPEKGVGGTYSHLEGFSEPDSHELSCGPFITYFAATLKDLEHV